MIERFNHVCSSKWSMACWLFQNLCWVCKKAENETQNGKKPCLNALSDIVLTLIAIGNIKVFQFCASKRFLLDCEEVWTRLEKSDVRVFSPICVHLIEYLVSLQFACIRMRIYFLSNLRASTRVFSFSPICVHPRAYLFSPQFACI